MTACLASIFERPYEEAPVLADPDTCGPVEQWLGVMPLWLHERGFHPQSFSLKEHHGARPPRSPWHWPTYWMAGVLSPRFTEKHPETGEDEPGHHAVVMHNSDLVWDPHPARADRHLGLVSAELFLPDDPARLVLVPVC